MQRDSYRKEELKNTAVHASLWAFSTSVFFCILFFFLFPHGVRAEYIESYVSDISVSLDSVFVVREEIKYIFTEEKHGIYRCIPTTHADPASSVFKERYVDIDFREVLMDGTNVVHSFYKKGDSTCIQIGDPNVTVTGDHTYGIEYVVSGATTYYTYGGADLYWNVTGNDWAVPIRIATARVSSPDGALSRERACYMGAEGKTLTCDISNDEQGTIIFNGRNLRPYEGLTVSQSLNRARLAYDVRERYNMLWAIIAFAIVALLTLSYVIYRYKTKFKTERAIIPQYEPYPGVKPMYSGLLFDKKLDSRDITAGIVYLAKEGFIRVRKTEKKALFFFEVDDYEVTLTKPASELTDLFDIELVKLLFGVEADVGKTVSLSDLKKDHSNQKENAALIRSLKSSLKEDLYNQGFFTKSDLPSFFKFYGVLTVVIITVLTFFAKGLFIVLIIFAIAAFDLIMSGRRTAKGYEALDHLKGFKDFLQVTESQRYIFHNAPEKNAEHFMEYLPYAIAFGVEKQWAKTFEEITIPTPDWYDEGGSSGTFSAVGLTQSLGGFSSAFAGAVQSPSGSASGGGGFSGGGSGGGGGGSW